MIRSPNKLDAVNPAFASLLLSEYHWRGVTDPERSAFMHRLFRYRWKFLLLSIVSLVGSLGLVLLWPPAPQQVELRFLAYTNNGYARIALFEITNHSAHAVSWTLHAEGRPLNFPVAVTEVIETNGEMRHIGSGGPLNLFGHESFQFGTDELKPSERKVRVSLQPYPMTKKALRLQKLSGQLYRLGWHSGAYRVKRTLVDGPVLP